MAMASHDEKQEQDNDYSPSSASLPQNAPPGSDPEKGRAKVSEHEPIGTQIDTEFLKELAPNGESDFLIEKVNAMSLEEAERIVRYNLVFHDDDWNFPSDMRERMTRAVKDGPEGYGEFYERDVKIDAVVLKWSSPYPGVRAVADPRDDGEVMCETPRAYFLGIVWACIGTFFSTFFNSRFPGISRFCHCPHDRHLLVVAV